MRKRAERRRERRGSRTHRMMRLRVFCEQSPPDKAPLAPLLRMLLLWSAHKTTASSAAAAAHADVGELDGDAALCDGERDGEEVATAPAGWAANACGCHARDGVRCGRR